MTPLKVVEPTAPELTLADAEPLLDDLMGAAFTAAALLEAIGRDSGDPGTPARRGLLWLSNRLSTAAENVRALDYGAPEWNTTFEADEIAKALEAAKEYHDARKRPAAD